MPFYCDQGYGRTSEAAGSKRTDQHTEERTSCTITFAYTRFHGKWCKYCYDGAEAGVDIVDLAIESKSSLTSQPSMNAVAEALRGTRRDTGLKPEELTELSHYYSRVREVYAPFESDMKSPNTEIYKYEIPGGQYSNLLAPGNKYGITR